MVKRTLLKPTYIGKRQHGKKGVVAKAEWKAIIEDEAVYAAIERTLTNPGRKTMKDNAVHWLLSGIATPQCGGLIRVRNNRGHKAYTCVTDFCCSMMVYKLDDIVQEALLEYAEKPGFAASLVRTGIEEQAKAAMAEAARMQIELDDARTAFGLRRLSLAAMSELEANLQPLIDAAYTQVRETDVSPVLRRLACAEARAVWEELDLPQRREAIRAVMTVQLNKAYSLGARKITPDRYAIAFTY